MKFESLGEMELAYEPGSRLVDFGPGGRFYGVMTGRWESERLRGRLHLTNTAESRPDNVNTPSLRGVLDTDDGAALFVEMKGVSQIEGGGRVFVASLTLRTAHPAYAWANRLLAVVEGQLHGRPRGGEIRAHCRIYACEATIAAPASGVHESARVTALALPLSPTAAEGVGRLGAEPAYSKLRERQRVAREAAFLAAGNLVIYRELEDASALADGVEAGLRSWLRERLGDAGEAAAPAVELLVRQRAAARGSLEAEVVGLPPGRATGFRELAFELNGIHCAEFEESCRRLGYGLTALIQHGRSDEAILVLEADDPAAARARIAASENPFERWLRQQLAALTGADPLVSSGAGPLWTWEG